MLTNEQVRLTRATFSTGSIGSYMKHNDEVYASAKLDGDGIMVKIEQGNAWIVNRGSTSYHESCPYLVSAVIEAVNVQGLDSALLVGEIHAGDGKLGDLYKIRTVIANDGEDLRISFFDLLELNGEDLRSEGFEKRYDILKRITMDNRFVRVLEQVKCKSAEEHDSEIVEDFP